MDLTTLIGAATGVIMVALAIMMRGDGIDIASLVEFFNWPSVMITFGGTLAATLVNYPIVQFLGVWKIAKKVFTDPDEDTTKLIGQLVTLAQKAKRDGFLALEADVRALDNDFLKRAIQLVIDGQDQDFIRTTLETEITFIQERHRGGQEIFVAMGTYCPAFGLVGTIIGLIQMLANLQDQAQIAAGMAVALLTTFYGATAAYLLFLPIAGKLKRRSQAETLIKEVIIRGVLLMQSGTTPSLIEANLQAYLEPRLRQQSIAAERAARRA